MRTWKILELGISPVGQIELICPNCGTDAAMPVAATSNPIIAAIGLNLVFDNPAKPEDPLPVRIQCRNCRSIFTQKEAA